MWVHVSSAKPLALTVTAKLARSLSNALAAISGHVPIIAAKRKRAETLRLHSTRESLIPARAKAKRHHKRVSIYDRALRDLTTELLRRGA